MSERASIRPSRAKVEKELEEEAADIYRFNAHLQKAPNMTMRTETAELRLSRPSDFLNLLLEAHADRKAAGEKDPFFEDALLRYRDRKVNRKPVPRSAR
jgi:hypothetical protein